ncbi:MAG: L-seryl-tRNA(Sec) selenium transferase [Micrococcales bacterium]|nr:MAG: L-seryl-tRNA(Sec) selenium transferase [Micrococcales bacterium]
MTDPRRAIPRTDALLNDADFGTGVATLGTAQVKRIIVDAARDARAGRIGPDQVRQVALATVNRLVERSGSSLTPVLNGTGVIVHTNIGRAPLSRAAWRAVGAATGYVDVEFDLDTGQRALRGRGAIEALRQAVPHAQDALVVNNGAAALVLACTALAAGRQIIVSRGELVEIGDGFRLPDLITSTGARLREVGTTNRTNLGDYLTAITPDTAAVLKVHPSNFVTDGFTGRVDVAELAASLPEGLPLISDIGSGLLHPEPMLPDEPDAASTLAGGAHLVTASGDKLLGGPQAGILLGKADVVRRLRRHPLARALRVDKLTLAAVEATVRGPAPPVVAALRTDPDQLRERTVTMARTLGLDEAAVLPAVGRVGGGGAPCHPLPGWALALPAELARPLRTGSPAILTRTDAGRCLLDLRCIPHHADAAVVARVAKLLAAETDRPGPRCR